VSDHILEGIKKYALPILIKIHKNICHHSMVCPKVADGEGLQIWTSSYKYIE
jgi:hypothetical protein